ncbi:hypothetical protein Bca52824_083931 [Brassica carinata]|uniref:non-specific serine/threonine protein kinase n=1 Tax=Brassica carinata TaxID=52824 RepID=A0A8X7PMC3_BRACI|nr:hypothetical protein Bca52824_083931 [Brassica carinata]
MLLLLQIVCFFFFFPIDAVSYPISKGLTSSSSSSSINLTPAGLLKVTAAKTQGFAEDFQKFIVEFKKSQNGTLSSFSTTFVFAIVAVRKTDTGCGLSFNISPARGLDMDSSNNPAVSVDFRASKSDKPFGKDLDVVGIDLDHSMSENYVPAGYYVDDGSFRNLSIASGRPIQVWVEYDKSTKALNVTLHPIHVTKSKTPLISLKLDLSPLLHEYMYIGFTSVGTSTSSPYILDWNFNSNGRAQDIDPSYLPEVPHEYQQDRSFSSKILVLSLSISGATLVIVLVFGVVFFLKRKKFLEVIEDWEVQFGPLRFTYKDLFIATKGFKNSELLGRGGFGKVFKGVLPLSSITIAVKKISHDSRQGMRDFLAEIATIGRLRHPDLVRLLGYCRRKGELYLVYDFMPKGSLNKFLYHQPDRVLDWSQRFKIIKDVASGLCYLHQQWVQVIIHRDIKPANILLDENMNAKLGDFGLAKLCDHGIDSQSSNVAGTFGYISPELSRTGKSSTSSDVFAFGVFMLEITCGRKPIDPRRSPSEVVLTDWVLECWDSGVILQAVDERLGHSYLDEQVTLVLKLGLLCSHPLAATRPSMSSVIQFLDGVATLPHNLLDVVNAREISGGFDALGEATESHGASSNLSSFVMTESLVSGGR